MPVPLAFDLTHGALLVAGLLVLIGLGFLFRFVWPAWRLGWELETALLQLAELPRDGHGASLDLDAIGRDIFQRGPLAHLWREYAHTLHASNSLDPQGRRLATRWRATAMAESFFSEQALVDIPLRTEFYKHLPGILTGLGILGTFAGLIAGLTQFEISNDPETVRSSLRALIQGVGHAFKVSAAAIGLAMLLTWIEKAMLAARYRQVAKLVQAIDSLFDSGVGEEYLARLVKASEASAAQGNDTARLLAGELKTALAEIMARQQQQFAAGLGDALAKAVSGALQEPMQRLCSVVEQNGRQQGDVVGQALQQSLTRFNQQMESTLGQRQDGLHSLLSQTAVALQEAVGELRQVARQLESAGRGTVESAASRLDLAGGNIQQAAASFASSFAATGTSLQQTVTTLATAAARLAETQTDQAAARHDFARMLADLRETVSVARRDAAVSSELVSRLESAANTLVRAEMQADQYLQGVSAVLGEAHAAFARNVEATLQQGNSQFQREIAAAVEHLRAIIEELGETLETLPARP